MLNTNTILTIALITGCFSTAAAAAQFTVGPNQDYKTISSALEKMKDGDVCIVNEGVYRECIDIQQNNVTLRGEGRVVITGCDKAGEMQPCVVNGHKGLKAAVGKPVYDVFRGDQYLMPARFPDKTSPMTSDVDWHFSTILPDGTVDFAKHAQKQFPGLSGGYYVGLHGRVGGKKLSSWYSISLPITGIDQNGHIEVNGAKASSGYLGNFGQGRGIGYIIGAKAVLDAPGEWYSDGNEVMLIPPRDGAGQYEVRTRLYGAKIAGNGVRLENIRFKAATARVDGNGVSFKHCAFDYISPFRHNANQDPENKQGRNLESCWGIPDDGTAGVFVAGNVFVAEDCRFAKSWWCGMMVRGNHARIENCFFEDVNWMAKRCAGLFSWGDGNVVRYCTFKNLGASAIEGGNAHWIGQYAKNNIWEYNYIENACKLIVDQGFFYVNQQNGANPKANSIWRYNVGKGSRGPEKGDWTTTAVAYYVDNSSSGYHIYNNIAIDANEALRYNDTLDGNEAGKDVWFYNNTFYNCDDAAYGCWTPGKRKAKADAEVMLVNNASVASDSLDFSKWAAKLNWKNNFDHLPASALKDPKAMDFTPTDKALKTGGIPVMGQAIPYVGAVDPAKGMWRYGADLSKLPKP